MNRGETEGSRRKGFSIDIRLVVVIIFVVCFISLCTHVDKLAENQIKQTPDTVYVKQTQQTIT